MKLKAYNRFREIIPKLIDYVGAVYRITDLKTKLSGFFEIIDGFPVSLNNKSSDRTYLIQGFDKNTEKILLSDFDFDHNKKEITLDEFLESGSGWLDLVAYAIKIKEAHKDEYEEVIVPSKDSGYTSFAIYWGGNVSKLIVKIGDTGFRLNLYDATLLPDILEFDEEAYLRNMEILNKEIEKLEKELNETKNNTEKTTETN